MKLALHILGTEVLALTTGEDYTEADETDPCADGCYLHNILTEINQEDA